MSHPLFFITTQTLDSVNARLMWVLLFLLLIIFFVIFEEFVAIFIPRLFMLFSIFVVELWAKIISM